MSNGTSVNSSPVRRSLRLRKLAPETVPNVETQKGISSNKDDKTEEKSSQIVEERLNNDAESSDEPLNLSMERESPGKVDDRKKVVKTLFCPKGKLKINGKKDAKSSPELLKTVETVKAKLSELNLINEDGEEKQRQGDMNGNIEGVEKEEDLTQHKEEMKTNGFTEEEETKARITEDVEAKMDELLRNVSYTESESEPNSLILSMAEEGEEDTPSEGSNDIVEVGEEINTTESELSTDESYEDNSFIDDEENHQLLSGDEFDLSFDDGARKGRIIALNCDSDEEIVRVEKREKKQKMKKSRIIKLEDSSDEEGQLNTEFKVVDRSVDSTTSEKENEKNEKEAEEDSKKENEDPLAPPEENTKKIIIIENIRVQENKELAECVNTILSSLGPEVKKTDQITAPQDQIDESRKKKEKKKPAFLTGNKNFFKMNGNVETSRKKRRKRKRKTKHNATNSKRRKKEETAMNCGWEEENVVIRPSLGDITPSQSIEPKFHSKDFRALMLQDTKKRVEKSRYLKKIH